MYQQIEDTIKQNKDKLESVYSSQGGLSYARAHISHISNKLYSFLNHNVYVRSVSSQTSDGIGKFTINLTDAFRYYLHQNFPSKYPNLPLWSDPNISRYKTTIIFNWECDSTNVSGYSYHRRYFAKTIYIIATDDLMTQIVESIFNGNNVEQNVHNYLTVQEDLRKGARKSKVCSVNCQSPRISVGFKQVEALANTVKIDL